MRLVHYRKLSAHRLSAVFTIAVYIMTSAITTIPDAYPLSGPAFAPAPADLSITIPPELGAIRALRTSQDTNVPMLFIIEDAHAQYAAQRQIYRLIEFLQREENVHTAFVEGAASQLDARRIRFLPDDERNYDLVDRLAQEGQITGIELYLLKNQHRFTAYGVEDDELYTENLSLFRRLLANRHRGEDFVHDMEKIIMAHIEEEETRSFRSWIRSWLSFRRNTMDIGTLLPQLCENAKAYLDIDLEHPISQHAWPQLNRLAMLKKLEGAIDRTAWTSEREVLIETLSENRSRFPLADVVKTAFAELDVPLTPVRYAPDYTVRQTWEALYADLIDDGITLESFPAIRTFLNYKIFEAELDAGALHDEVTRLGEELLYATASTERGRTWVRPLQNLLFVRDAFSLWLEPEALPAFTARIGELLPSQQYAQIAGLAGEGLSSGEAASLAPAFLKLDETVAGILTFYQDARKREAAMVSRILEISEKRNTRKAIFVLGGFHTDGVVDRLRAERIPFAVITPHIQSVDPGRSLYYTVMGSVHPSRSNVPPRLATDAGPISLSRRLAFGTAVLDFGQPTQATDVNQAARYVDRVRTLRSVPTIDTTGFGAAGIAPEEEAFLRTFAKNQTLSDVDVKYFKTLLGAFRDTTAAKDALRIITPNEPKGNFKPSALLTAQERKDLLGAVDYTDFLMPGTRERLLRIAQKLHITTHLMEGGLGSSVGRESYLKRNVPGREDGKIGAKGTDLMITFDATAIDRDGISSLRTKAISIAESKLLFAIRAAENDTYSRQHYVPLVNVDSKPSYVRLFDSIYLPDRLDDRISDEQKRSYRQAADKLGLRIAPNSEMVIQRMLPTIDKATGTLTDERIAPGGHGQLGVLLLARALEADLAEQEIDIRVFANGDNLASNANPLVAAWMAEEKAAIVMISTEATPIDKKGGKIGVYYENGSPVRVQMMELAQAKKAGQQDVFEATGIAGGPGDTGQQYFNTNIAYLNYSLLRPVLTGLRRTLGEEEFFRVIGPDLITNEKEQGDKKYIQLEGAIGSALLNLSAYIESTTNPAVRKLVEDLGIKKFLRIVNVPATYRTEFFTPIKTAFDYWLQFFSNYYTYDPERYVNRDRLPNTVPPGAQLEGPMYEQVQYLIDALGRADVEGLTSLTIAPARRIVNKGQKGERTYWGGGVRLPNVRRSGTVRIESKTWAEVNLTDPHYHDALAGYYVGDQLWLKDVIIKIRRDRTLEVTPIDSGFGLEQPSSVHPNPLAEELNGAYTFSVAITQRVYGNADEDLERQVRERLLAPYMTSDTPREIAETLDTVERLLSRVETSGTVVLSASNIRNQTIADKIATRLSRHIGFLYVGDTPEGRSAAVNRLIHTNTNIEGLDGLRFSSAEISRRVENNNHSLSGAPPLAGLLGSSIRIGDLSNSGSSFVVKILDDGLIRIPEVSDESVRESLTARTYLALLDLTTTLGSIDGGSYATLRRQIADKLMLGHIGPDGVRHIESFAEAYHVLKLLARDLETQQLILQAA